MSRVQKTTNGGCILYVHVRSCFEAAVSITWGIWRGLSCSHRLFWAQIALAQQLRTGTYKLHPPLIVIPGWGAGAEDILGAAQKLLSIAHVDYCSPAQPWLLPKAFFLPSEWINESLPQLRWKINNKLDGKTWFSVDCHGSDHSPLKISKLAEQKSCPTIKIQMWSI